MSIKLMSRVWDDSQHSGGHLLVLLALADFADERGHCFPTMETLARKARLSTRQVRTILRDLEASGEIRTEAGGGRGKRSQYRVLPPPERPASEALTETVEDENAEIISGKLFQGNYYPEKITRKSTTPKRGSLRHSDDPPSEPSQCAESPPESPPIRHVIRHGVGGGGAPPQKNENEPTETERYLLQQGVHPTSAHRFMFMDLLTIQQDFSARRADGQSIAMIISAWKARPPSQETLYVSTRSAPPQANRARSADPPAPARPLKPLNSATWARKSPDVPPVSS